MEPIYHLSSLEIGIVDYVSADLISVTINQDAPTTIALNAGMPRPFPRLNSYVLIRGEGGFLVAQIEDLSIKRDVFYNGAETLKNATSAVEKRFAQEEKLALLNLPREVRQMSLAPLGMLHLKSWDTDDLKDQNVSFKDPNSPFKEKNSPLQDNNSYGLPSDGGGFQNNALNNLNSNLRSDFNQDSPSDYYFTRGVDFYPTIGDPVLLPTSAQLKAIVESGDNRHLVLGYNPIAGNATVAVDPDKLFGRHLAILGNTGSGKSCTVAGLVHWSLQAIRQYQERSQRLTFQEIKEKQLPIGTLFPKAYEPSSHARFIILDPNGEYLSSFANLTDCTVNCFSATSKDHPKVKPLKVPMWLWNSEEWLAILQASDKTQKPGFLKALKKTKFSFDLCTVNKPQFLPLFLRHVSQRALEFTEQYENLTSTSQTLNGLKIIKPDHNLDNVFDKPVAKKDSPSLEKNLNNLDDSAKQTQDPSLEQENGEGTGLSRAQAQGQSQGQGLGQNQEKEMTELNKDMSPSSKLEDLKAKIKKESIDWLLNFYNIDEDILDSDAKESILALRKVVNKIHNKLSQNEPLKDIIKELFELADLIITSSQNFPYNGLLDDFYENLDLENPDYDLPWPFIPYRLIFNLDEVLKEENIKASDLNPLKNRLNSSTFREENLIQSLSSKGFQAL